jgi:hypothetical protein
MEPIRISSIDRLGRVEPPITDERGQPPPTDTAFADHELLVELAKLLGRATRGRPARRSERWAEGEPFSFNRRVQTEWDAAGGLRHQTSKRDAAATWDAIAPIASKAVDVLTGSLVARRIARVVPGLCDNAAVLAEHIPPVRDLVDLLAIEDDAVFLVLHPPTERGFRIQVAGIENNFELQVLLADLLADDDSAGQLPAERPDPRVVAVCRGEWRQQEGLVGRASFGMYSAGALRADLTLPEGLACCDHWLWGAAAPASIPYFDGERVILLGPPPFRMTWDVERRFPRVRGEAQLVEVLDRETVRGWLRRLADADTGALTKRALL